jgi:hypothetical protein
VPGLVPLLAVVLAAHAPVVAGPTDSGVKMVAFDRGDKLCTQLRSPEQHEAPDCGRPMLTLRSFGFGISSSQRRSIAEGLVVPEVAAVELVFRGGRRVRAATSAGERYHGRYAGKLRFFLAEWRSRRDFRFEEPLYARLLGSQGELLAVRDLSYQGVRVGPRATVARGRVGGERWSLVAFKRRVLAPLPGDEERFVEATCVALEDHSAIRFPGDERVGRAEDCRYPDQVARDWELNADRGCHPVGGATVGFAPADARRLEAVLGDGRRQRVPILRLPGRIGGERAFVLALDRRTALRRLVGIDRDGRHVLTEGVAPGVLDCPFSGGTLILFSFGPDRQRERSGPLGFQVVDRGVLVCPSLVGPPRASDCVHPPLDDYEEVVLTHPTQAATTVAGVVPAQVAAVVLKLDGGERVRLATSFNGPYMGRYAGRLRFFSALLAGRRRVEAVRPIDDHGRSLPLQQGPDPVPPDEPFRVLMRAGGYRLGATTFTYDDEHELCLQLARGAFSPSLFACRFASDRYLDLGVEVPCSPREILIWGMLKRRAHAVYADTSVGRVDGRVVPLPRRLHTPGRAFVLALPAQARPTSLTFPGARTPRMKVRMPSAAEQCGWNDSLF